MRLSSDCLGRRSEPSTCAASTSATGLACIARLPSTARRRQASWQAPPGFTSAMRSSGSSSRRWAHPRRQRGRADGVQRFVLPVGHAEALLDEESLNYASPFGRLLVACLRPIDALLDAYRNGGGVPYADYGADLHEGQAAFTRPLFSRLLAQEWLPSVPEIHARLLADPPARVADVACGGGISSIAIARGYPKVHVDGIDLDTASIESAHRHLAGSGVEDRVTFEAGMQPTSPWAAVRPRDGVRSVARHVLPGRRIAGGAGDARGGRRRPRG